MLFNLEQKIWAIRLNISYFHLVGWYPDKAELKDPSATEWFFFEGQGYNLSSPQVVLRQLWSIEIPELLQTIQQCAQLVLCIASYLL